MIDKTLNGKRVVFSSPANSTALLSGIVSDTIDDQYVISLDPAVDGAGGGSARIPAKNILTVLYEEDAVPRILTSVRNRAPGQSGLYVGINPNVKVDGVTHELMSCHVHEKELVDDSLRLVLENDFPDVRVELMVNGVVNTEVVRSWLKEPTALTCDAPRILIKASDQQAPRLLVDEAWAPIEVSFRGPYDWRAL